MFIKLNNKRKGFTLIELMVSIAIFSIVVVVALSSVLTISDANKKARSLMTVMNNLNFSVDSMTRSFKTGSVVNLGGSNRLGDSAGNKCFATYEVNYSSTSSAQNVAPRRVEYCWIESNGLGKITKQVGTATPTDLTSKDIDIDFAYFDVTDTGQPLLKINLQGEVRVSPTVSSDFTIQTAVSQRQIQP